MNRATKRHRMRPLVASLACVPVLVASLAACSSSKSSNGKSSGPASSPSNRPTAVIDVSVPPGTSKNYVGARSDVTGLKCTQAGSGWKVSGSVTNSGKVKADYRIYTSMLTKDNVTRGLLESDVKGVASKATKKWSGQLALAAKNLRCVLRVERTNAG
jgi:hypothetical protein